MISHVQTQSTTVKAASAPPRAAAPAAPRDTVALGTTAQETTPVLKPSLREYLTLPGVGGPSWSPDGKSLAYLSNSSGQMHVHRRGQDGTDRQITSGNLGVDFVTWTRDGEWMLFGADTDGDERRQLHLVRPDGTGHRNLTNRPGVIHEFGGFSPDGKSILYASNGRDQAHFDLYTMDLATGEATCIHQGEGMLGPAGFSPDGSKVLFSRHTSNLNNDLFLLDVATKGVRHLTPHEGDARYSGAQFAKDGTSILMATDRSGEFMALERLDLGRGTWSTVAAPKWDVEDTAMSADGSTLAFSCNEDGYSKLYLLDTATGGVRPGPEIPQGVAGSLDFREDGKLSLKLGGPTRTSSLCLADVATGKTETVLEAGLGNIDPAGLVAPELVHYPTFDGRQIPAFLYRPTDAPADQPLPAVVVLHGGPESQTRPNFSPLHQYLVDQGFAVLAPNIRGSVGYGKTFTHLDDVEKRMDALKDVTAANKFLAQVGVDSARIAVMGGSYGGYMTLVALAFDNQNWAAGVDIVGMSNLETFMKNTGPWRMKLRAAEYGDPVKDQQLLRDISPIHRVDDIRAPLMIIQGANDPRVPKTEADQMAQAMRDRGAEVEYLLYEDEGHGLAKLPNKISGYESVARFLKKHLAAEA